MQFSYPVTAEYKVPVLLLVYLSLLVSCGFNSYDQVTQTSHAEQLTVTRLKPQAAFHFAPAASYPNPFQLGHKMHIDPINTDFVNIDDLVLTGIIYRQNNLDLDKPYAAAIVTDSSSQMIRLIPGQQLNNGQWQVARITDQYIIISNLVGNVRKHIGFNL